MGDSGDGCAEPRAWSDTNSATPERVRLWPAVKLVGAVEVGVAPGVVERVGVTAPVAGVAEVDTGEEVGRGGAGIAGTWNAPPIYQMRHVQPSRMWRCT